MRQLRDMSIMEIDITNACHKKCSNCTRLCGHHKKPFFMDFDTFTRAVDSLKGYGGLISTIGGEPLLHPEYNRFAEYLQAVRGQKKSSAHTRANAIVRDYLAASKIQRWFEGAIYKGRGYTLFTSIPRSYYKNFESIQDTVTDLWLNDHTSPSFHQPLLISRHDLGISDEEFAPLRDNCWLQNFWSGSITPKGCFFCEIAGALDMFFDGSGGKPIEPGWWERDISEFSDQFHWCDLCGMALSTFSRNAKDEIDDVSPTLYEKLKALDSPKLRQKRVNLIKSVEEYKSGCTGLGSDMASAMGNYLPINEERVGDLKEYMRPNAIIEICGMGLDAAKAIRENCGESSRSWLLYKEPGVVLPNDFISLIKERYLNPGYLFLCRFDGGEAVLFSPIAKAAKRLGFDGLRDIKTIAELVNRWGEKVHVIESGFDSLPDIDISLYRDKAFQSYDMDEQFKLRLRDKLSEQGVTGGDILVLQSAFVFHTLSIIRLLENMGYTVHVLTSERFLEYFDGWLPKEHIHVFKGQTHFNYEKLKDIRENLKQKTSFAGAIVPFSFGSSSVKHIENYTDAMQTAEDISGKILGIINIRREFIESEYDIWEIYNARNFSNS